MTVPPTEIQPPRDPATAAPGGDHGTAHGHGPRRPGWLVVALAAAAGFLAGVLLVIVLGGPKPPPARTITKVSTTITTGGRPVVQVRVPDLVGLPLPDARDRLDAAGFDADVQGLGLFGGLFEGDYSVTGQLPAAGTFLERGGTVRVEVSGG